MSATTASSPASLAAPVTASIRRGRRRGARREAVIRAALFACAFLSVATMLGIVLVLLWESGGFFAEVGILEFLTGTRWSPILEPQSFGVLPLVCGTLLVTAVAAIVALPLGLGSAMFLAEIATPRLRGVLKPVLEILAGIPTVVYGYFALTTVTPVLMRLVPSTQIFNAASAGIVVGIMILPMVASLCDDAFAAVPGSLRSAGYALGATRAEVTTRIVLPASLSGVLASFVLAISRAIGETMAVTLAAGATPRMTFDPFLSIQTMTAFIVQLSLGDTPAGSIEFRSLFAVGLLLFAMTLVMNVVSHVTLKRFREVYE